MSGPTPSDSQLLQIDGLLQTVGGRAEPIVHALLNVRPRFAALVASEESQKTVVEVKEQFRQRCPDGTPEFKTFLSDDAANLVACHRAASEAIAWLRNQCELARDAIRIDFTGGTKAMSAATVLAAAPDGYCFLYVSGEDRDKDGLGIVVSGTEQLLHSENPWTVLEEFEIRRLLDMAASAQWIAALEAASRLLQRASDQRKPIFKALSKLLEGLRDWDHFKHQSASQGWNKGQTPSELARLAKVGGLPLLKRLAERCQPMIGRLQQIAQDSPDGSCAADPLVLDMIANGDRRLSRARTTKRACATTGPSSSGWRGD